MFLLNCSLQEGKVRHIKKTVTSLIERFGPPRREVSLDHALGIYNTEGRAALVRYIAQKFFTHGMPVIRVDLVRKGGFDAPAWVESSGIVAMYGTEAFRRTTFTLYIRQEYIEEVPFSTLVSTISHEMAHIVLFSVGKKNPHDEKEVDLIAMHFGFFEIHKKGKRYQVRRKKLPFAWDGTTSLIQNIFRAILSFREVHYDSYTRGYLTSDEVSYARNVMVQSRAQ